MAAGSNRGQSRTAVVNISRRVFRDLCLSHGVDFAINIIQCATAAWSTYESNLFSGQGQLVYDRGSVKGPVLHH